MKLKQNVAMPHHKVMFRLLPLSILYSCFIFLKSEIFVFSFGNIEIRITVFSYYHPTQNATSRMI